MPPGADPRAGGRVHPKAWSGRLQGPTDPLLERYSTSVQEDLGLAEFDIRGSAAHAGRLARAGLIRPRDHQQLLAGLEQIASEVRSGSFEPRPEDEDIHMAVERRLAELIGEPALRLHTGRSRNDQVALDLRLWTRAAAVRLSQEVLGLEGVLLRRARRERETLVPGYTHLQRAQPVSLAHHLLAYFEMLERDRERLQELHRRAGLSPLGAGALAGSTLPLDRRQAARELGLLAPTANSLDSVSDRDFALELLFASALIAVHLSRLAEDLIIWSTAEFGFLELPDRWSTGSSLMPQKRNPDLLELVRGRAARPVAALLGLLLVLKGLPLSYNRDLQEDKSHLFPAVASVEASLEALAGMLGEVSFNRERMAEAASDPRLLATDLAERLVQEGVPFRRAHELVGRLVSRAEAEGQSLDLVLRESWQQMGFAEDPTGLLDPRSSLAAREQPGAPGPGAQRAALRRAAAQLRRGHAWVRRQSG